MNVTIEDLRTNLDKVNIIDVREPNEYKSGHIKGAKNIPMMGLIVNASNFLNKDDEYYIVCATGGRSSMVTQKLLQNGYKAKNVVGGTVAYANKYEVER